MNWLRRLLCSNNNHIPLNVVWGIAAWYQPSFFSYCARCGVTYYGPWECRPKIKGLSEYVGNKKERSQVRYNGKKGIFL